MSREIKFRYVFERNDDAHIFMVLTSIEGIEELSGQLLSMLQNELWHLKSRNEYTGLKDKNGKEIYEGDILENKKYGGMFQIIWGVPDESYAGWAIKWIKKHSENDCIDYDLLYNKNKENCQIIGNIYENPELLK